MISTHLASVRSAARRRLDPGGDDSGFVLIYTLMVVTVVTILVGSVLVVSSSSVVPSVQSAYSNAADAAAQGGVQDFLAYANANCQNANSSVQACTLPSMSKDWTDISGGTGGSYQAKYTWTAQKDPGYGYFRVQSTGVAIQGGVSSTRTLVADVSGGASTDVRDYAVVTGYETQSPDVVQAAFPKRSVALSSAVAAQADLVSGSGATTVSWDGATAMSGVAGCNALFYGAAGRGQNPPVGSPTPYTDWREAGTVNGSTVTDYQPCQVGLGSSTKLESVAGGAGLGGYASKDALLISNSYPGGTGPLLNQRVTTGYQYDPSTATACEKSGRDYRTFDLTCAGFPVNVGGTPTGTFTPAYNATIPAVPSSAPVVAAGACVYTGPTRMLLNADGTATITSPYTTSTPPGSPPGCYPASVSGGIFQYTTTTPLSLMAGFNGIIQAKNIGTPPAAPSCTDPTTGTPMRSSSGWNVTCQRVGDAASPSNSVFYTSVGAAGTTSSSAETETAADLPYAPAVGDTPATKPDGAWTPKWTRFTTGTSCTTSTDPADLKFFNCYQSGGSYSAGAYSTLKATVKGAIAAAPTSNDSASTLQAYLTGILTSGNSPDAKNAAPSKADNTSHRWSVAVSADNATTDGCTPATAVPGTTTKTAIAAPGSDPLMTNRAGVSVSTPSTATTCLTATVSLQIGTCNVALVLGVCVNLSNYAWGNGSALLGAGSSIPQFTTTFSVRSTATSTTVTPAVSSFPVTTNPNDPTDPTAGTVLDATQYSTGSSAGAPGDLYVAGTATSTIALVANNDVIVTNNLSATSPSAVEIVSQDNVRVYHPVTCTSNAGISSTTPGFCPNDITGLYSGIAPAGYRPDQQYGNLPGAISNVTISAAILALGGSTPAALCPQPTGAGGTCGGQFGADNYNRGASLGTVTITGTVTMQHHGPVGQEWEIADTNGQSSRPYSGYQLDLKYQNLKAPLAANTSVAGVVNTVSTTSSLWHVVSVSTGSGS